MPLRPAPDPGSTSLWFPHARRGHVRFRGRGLPGLTVLLAALALAAALPAGALAAGTPDPSFGTGGYTSVGSAIQFNGAAVQSNGELVAAGEQGVGSAADVVVARFTAQGRLDPSFGSGGLAAGPAVAAGGKTGSLARAVAIQSDGKIVVVGKATDGSGSGRGGLLIERFNANGSLDTSFGSGGVVNLLSATFGDGYGVAIQSDGKILATGSDDAAGSGGGTTPRVAVARLQSNGSLDPSFGSGGTAVIDLGAYSFANAVAVQSNGAIVIAGSQSPGSQSVNALIARLTPTGALDPSFNGSGTYAHQYAKGSANSGFNAVAIQPNGMIVAAGANSDGNSGADAFVARFTTAGAPDGSFGSGGVAYATSSQALPGLSGASIPGANAVTIAGNGDVVLAGSSVESLQSTGMLWAFTASGAPDAAFGTAGAAKVAAAQGASTALGGLAQASDGSLLVAGDQIASYNAPPSGLAGRFTGLGPAPGPPPPPPPPPTAALRLTVSSVSVHNKTATALKHGLHERATCNLACTVTVTVTANAATARQLGITTRVRVCRKVHGKRRCTVRHLYRALTLGRATGRLVAGHAKTVTVKIAGRFDKALRRRKVVSLALVTRATSGKTVKTHTAKVTLHR